MIRVLTTDFFDANVYLCFLNGKSCLIDCGGTPEFLLNELKAAQFVPEYVLLTHGHIDHISALNAVWEHYRPQILIHEQDGIFLKKPEYNLSTALIGEPFVFEGALADFETGRAELTVRSVHTPGHTPGSVTYLYQNHAFTGDTLFKGGIGSTAFPLGDLAVERASVRALLELPSETVILPGHGCDSTVGDEQNYFKTF